MADIISGSSRFNGDKNAPARKVIQMNNVSEAATHETEDDEIVKHRIKKHRRHMVIIAAIGVIVIAIAVVLVMRLIDGYVFTSYSVTGSLNREDIESSGYIAYGDGYIRYSMMVQHIIRPRARHCGTRHILCRSRRLRYVRTVLQ